MRDWFWRPKPPEHHSENPGRGISMEIATSNGVENRSESIDLGDLLERVLVQYGYEFKRHGFWFVECSTGMTLSPQIASFQPLDDMGASSCTTIECRHPDRFPDGVFEFQHSTGDTFESSIEKGFEQWLQLDLQPLIESFQEKPADCTTLRMDLPSKGDRPELHRRAVLGGVLVMNTDPERSEDDDEHPLGCPCCLLTNTYEAFKQFVETEGFYGIRLFAMRSEDGSIAADCRVNGIDFELGSEALITYAKTWPGAGMYFRKQYIVLHSI